MCEAIESIMELLVGCRIDAESITIEPLFSKSCAIAGMTNRKLMTVVSDSSSHSHVSCDLQAGE